MNLHEKLNYVEYHAADLTATKKFFETIFGWKFQDYGPEYTAFSGGGFDGGFHRSNLKSSRKAGAALMWSDK